jgi:hybrid cluster-associated redox disulfide protein
MMGRGKKEVYQMAQVTKDMTIAQVLDMDENTAPIFLEFGMHCLGCPVSRGETLEEAAAVHGIQADTLVESLNQYLAGK